MLQTELPPASLAPPWPRERPGWLWRLNTYLAYKNGSLPRYIGFCSAITIIPTILIYYCLWAWVSPAQLNENRFTVIDYLVVAPLVETFAMAFFLTAVAPQIPHKGVVVVVVALFAGVVHSRSQELGTHAFWGFYVYSIAFLSLRTRYSFGTASMVVCLVHALYNLVAIGCGALEEYLGFPTS